MDVSSEVSNSIEPYYESLHHMLNLEFVSIRPELKSKLGADVEALQREKLISILDESFKDREKYFKNLVK
jgi:hypothetical protein